MRRFALLCTCLTIGVFASRAQNEAITVSAAASLKEPLAEICKGRNVTLNFGGSGALQQQIENGAPVDVFISAAPQQMDALESKGLLVPGSRRDLLRNELALIAAAGTEIRSFQDLTNDAVKRIAIGEPKSVPVGKYAQEVFTSLKLLDAVKAKLVFTVDVRQVLASVESRNADAGVVYVSDAKTSKNVRVVATAPDGSHSPIVYPVAIIKASAHRADAEKFEQLLLSPEAAAIFTRCGFVVAH